jgi:UDP-glucose 4-epimerase
MAAAFVLALEACELGESAVYNVGSGNRTSVRDAIETVETVTGFDAGPAQHQSDERPTAEDLCLGDQGVLLVGA